VKNSLYKISLFPQPVDMQLLTAHEWFLSKSPDNQFDGVSPVFDDGDGIRVQQVFGAVAIDLQEFIPNLEGVGGGRGREKEEFIPPHH
jgi:hypothetical protein